MSHPFSKYLLLGSLVITQPLLSAESVTFNFLLAEDDSDIARQEKSHGGGSHSTASHSTTGHTASKANVSPVHVPGTTQHGSTGHSAARQPIQSPTHPLHPPRTTSKLYTPTPSIFGPPTGPGTGITQPIHRTPQQVHTPAVTAGRVHQFIHGRNQSTIRFSTHAHDWKNRLPSIQSTATAQRVHAAASYRHQVRTTYTDRHSWFTSNFWTNHHLHPQYWSNHFNCWHYTSWPFLTGWCGWNWTYPDYYDSGYSISVTSPDDENYLQSGSTFSSSLDSTASWQPLGVFAISPAEDWDETPEMFLQLAIAKDGTIAGTFYNHQTNETFPVSGQVDPQSQRTVWEITSSTEHPIFETGLYNLTLPETSVQVHFSDSDIENWLLVRVQ